MKKRISILLGCILSVCLASCQKQIPVSEGGKVGELVAVEVNIGNTGSIAEPSKSAIYCDNTLDRNVSLLGDITLWAYSNEKRAPDVCVTFRKDATPKLWLRSGVTYSVVAVCNVELPVHEKRQLMKKSDVLSQYETGQLEPLGNLPMMAMCNTTATQGVGISLAFCHSWAKVNLAIDASGLNKAFTVSEAKMYAFIGSSYAECDYANNDELNSKDGSSIVLYCPTTASNLPYIEVTGDLATSFKGTVTYRIKVGENSGNIAPKEYSYTLKPTLEHLIYKDGYEWEVEEDIYLGDMQKFKVQANLDHSNYFAKYASYYPLYWQDLSSSSGSTFSLALVERANNLIIPKKWYTLTQKLGEDLSDAGSDEFYSGFRTKHLGVNSFVFSAPKAPTTLTCAITTIWQPKLTSMQPVPPCPDSDLSSIKFGTELTSMTYTGTIKSPNGTARSFTSNVARYTNADSVLDGCRAPSSISVTGRTENISIPVIENNLQIISEIEKQTQNYTWGSAYNIAIKSKVIKYTLPSNNTTYQKYIYPNIVMSGYMNTTIYMNGRTL